MEGPTLIDHREQPPGVLPRHLREWVLIGIAVVMIGILAMGGGSPKPHTTTASPAAAAVDPNQQRIEAYQARIQEQAQRLAQEQAELERAKRAAEPGAPATRPEVTGSRPTANGELPTAGPTPTSTASSGSTTQGLRQERAQRDYRSLFVDNVAFSREGVRGDRSTVATASASETPAPGVPSLPAVARAAPTSLIEITDRGRPAASTSSTTEAPTAPAPDESVRSRPDRHSAPATGGMSAGGASLEATYRLSEGTIVETVLTNRLDGTFAGPVNCLVTTAVYASDYQHLLIPAGSRALGEARPVNAFGQSRLAVVFHRFLLPNGTRVDLEAFHGLNQVGETGLRDLVDRHYAQIFGA
jgi:type IV secretory pathway VirB10-like protein